MRALPILRTNMPCFIGRVAVVVAAGLLPTLAWADEPRWFSLDSSTQRIVGGEPANACEWPTTVSLGGCTGTLVHPRVVIYAAHCGDSVGVVRFGETPSGGGRQAAVQACEVSPDYGTKPGTDHAYCVLVERHAQTDIPIVPPLMGCETDILVPGAEVAVVGFGQDDFGKTGTKRKVTTTINSVSAEASIGGEGKDSCYGDSGGPVYIRHPDGAWRVFGITSYGITADCGPGGWYSMMHAGMEWIEARVRDEYGIDLTVCHDADGTWRPGPECGGFPLEAEIGHGTWDNGCSGSPVSGFSNACGPGFDELEPDEEPPVVTIVSPADGQRFDGTTPLDVDVIVDASDGMGSGVDRVELWLNGVALAGRVDSSSPYTWAVPLDAGMHTFAAVAFDVAGNEAMSMPIDIGINADAMPDEPSSTGDDPAGDDKGGCGCGVASAPGPLAASWLVVGGWGVSRRRRRLQG